MRSIVGVTLPDAAGIRQRANDRVEVPAVGIEIHRRPVGRPDVLGGEEVRQRLEPPVEVRVVPVMRRPRDRVAEFLAGIVFDREHSVDIAAESKRADHVVRRSDQVVAAQRLEAVVLLARHPARLVGGSLRTSCRRICR